MSFNLNLFVLILSCNQILPEGNMMEWQERPQTVVVEYIKEVIKSSTNGAIRNLSAVNSFSNSSLAKMAYEDEGKKLKSRLSSLRLDSLSAVSSVRFDN